MAVELCSGATTAFPVLVAAGAGDSSFLFLALFPFRRWRRFRELIIFCQVIVGSRQVAQLAWLVRCAPVHFWQAAE